MSNSKLIPYKVFGIGLNKTGTKTLGHALATLGFSGTTFNLMLLEDISRQRYDRLFDKIKSFSAFEDWPYPLVYPVIDSHFPGNKFILTTRSSPEKWLESLMRHALHTDPVRGAKCRSLAYGFAYPQLNPDAHLKIYTTHLERAREYFHGREEDYLEVCWENGDGWQKICTFLQLPVPTQSFPHVNRGAEKPRGKNYTNNLHAITSLLEKNSIRSSCSVIQPLPEIRSEK